MRRTWLIAVCLVMCACGSDQKVGSEKLLQFTPQAGNQRLGEATPTPVGTAGSLALGMTPRVATPQPTPVPTAEKFFDVALVADSPYYEPGNELTMSSGLTLRVTNKDATAERQFRRFRAENGLFDSGRLKVGQSWTYRFPGAASGRIKFIDDESFPFAFGYLTVTP